MKLFEPDLGDAYFAAFSTRQGGVSEGDFESLNLGILTDDEPDRVVENRRILSKAVGADPETATMAWQVHGARVFEADGRGVVTPGTDFEQGDGLWTEKPGRALGLLTADCFPVVLARRNGTPRLVVLHVGWRGLVEGILESGVAAVAGTVGSCDRAGNRPLLLRGGGGGRRAVPRALRRRRHAGANLDLAEAIERGLSRGRGRERRAHRPLHELRARALLLPPPRPGPHGAARRHCLYPLTRSAPITSGSRTRWARASPLVVATKYVSTEEMEALAEAGVPVVGENRLQDLEAKHARFGERFRWHFIGHLQSRKARDVSSLCELVHSLDSLSAAKRLTAPALVEVNLSGEETKSGRAARRSWAPSWRKRAGSESTFAGS